ncbi:glycosyltransferase family 4 protein [Candidatus Bathyarchaeota archaeon]|nr:MAG: glycosyltransferase family 4 protein [Candidatus Bathyarchaeota archaeon]
MDRNDFIICFVGSLVAWQGIPTLIAAAERLRTRIPHLRIVMVGGGPDTDALKAQVWQSSVRDICIFAGEVPYEDVPTIIAASDVCVAPFARTRKASPIKVFEYLACGKPVVSSDIDDIGDFLKRSRAGVVIEPGNAEALANGIEWVYNHPEEALELARRGRLAVEQTRSWEETAKKVSAILESIRIASPS